MEEYMPIHLSHCPRCRGQSYERLRTHSYCADCNYSDTIDQVSADENDDCGIPRWALDALKDEIESSPVSQARFEKDLFNL